ncbi:hypothetical protein AKO1_007183 [Acrasis kona]|uniref:Uncharacterized protein n=1 Tax=Acrasis kona TaxID=1008807 RepID=A0AAW2YTP7_9EUKA
MSMQTTHNKVELQLQPLRTAQLPSGPGASLSSRRNKRRVKTPSLYEHAILNNATQKKVLTRSMSPYDADKLRICRRYSANDKEAFIYQLKRAERVNNNPLWVPLYSAWDLINSI